MRADNALATRTDELSDEGEARMVELELQEGPAVVTSDRRAGETENLTIRTRTPRAAVTRLWVSEERREPAEKVMTRGK